MFFLLLACAAPPKVADTSPADTAATETGGEDTAPDSDDTGGDSAAPDEHGDGYGADVDCDDTDEGSFPGAPERCNGRDDDCDEVVDEDAVDAPDWYPDADGDGYGAGDPVRACTAPEGTAAYAGDCDDGDGRYHPGAEETDCADPADYNCDGQAGGTDGDGDGWAACEECADGDPTRHPGVPEVCDELDQDCDGVIDEDAADATEWYIDRDGDGYGDPSATERACGPGEGRTDRGSDCDDGDAGISPAAEEVPTDGVDQDCDGWDAGVDSDGDGLEDETEVDLGTDPTDPDGDDDGWSDGEEHLGNTDPEDADDHPYTGGWEIDACRHDLTSTGTAVGDVAPDFALTDVYGEAVHLHDFCGKAVLLDFGTFW